MIDLQRKLVRRRLRPEAVAGAGHGGGQNESVDLSFFETSLAEKGFEDFGAEFPDVTVAFFDNLGLRIAHDRRVMQCHSFCSKDYIL
ncbi:MAG: hypothetical protein WA858_30155, partial [Xanthobacteraceae bacterium]